MKLLKTVCFGVCLTLLGCDDRFEFLDGVNAPPTLSISRTGHTSESPVLLQDGIKTSLKHNNLPYVFALTAADRETVLQKVSFRFLAGNGQLYQGGDAVNGEIVLTAGEAALRFEPGDVGKVIIEFTVADDFKKTGTARAEFNVFVNLPPVAKLTYTFVGAKGPYEYLLDASGSFDQDADQGGEIQAYRFVINETYVVVRNQPVMTHNFAGPGPDLRDVRLEVIDTDGASAMVSQVVR